MYIIDTDVLSALRRGERSPGAFRWLQAQRTSDLYLSVVTIGEIERGIEQQKRHNTAFASDLAAWLDRILGWYGDRILPVDLVTAQRWGRLSATLGYESADLLIAATALEHGLIVLTPNVMRFEPIPVPVFNPFAREGEPDA